MQYDYYKRDSILRSCPISYIAPCITYTTPHYRRYGGDFTQSIFRRVRRKKVKRLVVFLALNGLSGEKRLAEEKLLLEETGLSKNDLSYKELWIPLEVMKLLFNQSLLNLESNKIARMTQSSNEKWANANWLALYRKFDWLYPEMVSTLSEFKALVKDARTYGQKTFEQIFSGFNLLKRIKENPNALAEMTIADLQQAGIYTDIWKFPVHDQTRETAPQNFLRWVQANSACILVCLRWVPARNFIPNLLAETANHGDLAIVKAIFAFLNEHYISPFNTEATLSNEEEKHLYISRALQNAVIKAHIPIADYLVGKEVQASVRWLPEDILHQVIVINPSFKNIEWLVENDVLLNHIGSDRLNSQDYGKTAADIAVSSLISWNFFSPSAEFRKNEMDRLHIALYLIDKGVPFNPHYQPKDMTLLHAVCYAEDIELGLRIARLVIEQDPSCIHTPTQDRNAFTPLHLAFKERKYRLMELLLEHGADATVRIQGNTVIELARQSKNLEDELFLQKTGNSGYVSKYNFNWVHPEWVSTRQEYAELTKDAVKYGQRDFEQIFEGLNILRLIKLAGPHAPITFHHLQRAGIVQAGEVYSDDPDARHRVQNEWVTWVRENPAHLLACLRWMPVQRDIPDVLVEAVKSKKVALVESVLEFMRKHAATTPLDTGKALELAVQNADIPIADYLLRKAGIHRLPANILHIAAATGCLEMVEKFINQGVLLAKKGRSQDNPNSYLGKTAAEVAVSTITASHFAPHAPQALRDHGVNLLSMARYLLQAGQAQHIRFDPTCTPTGTTLLHAACYAPSEQEGLWLARWAFNQNPAYIHEVDSEGRMPLYRAIQQKRSRLIDFLLNNGAQINLSLWDYTALKLNDPDTFSLLKSKKKRFLFI